MIISLWKLRLIHVAHVYPLFSHHSQNHHLNLTGFAADSYIFASPASTLTPAATFTSTMPMFLNDIVSSNRSTMHQSHVSQHKKGFDKLSGMVKDLYGKSKSFLPPYVNTACTLK